MQASCKAGLIMMMLAAPPWQLPGFLQEPPAQKYPDFILVFTAFLKCSSFVISCSLKSSEPC